MTYEHRVLRRLHDPARVNKEYNLSFNSLFVFNRYTMNTLTGLVYVAVAPLCRYPYRNIIDQHINAL